MLQQTQVTTAIPYFRRFVARFRSLRSLSRADLDDVLAAWSGLGYYSRARNLHRAAQMCVAGHRGALPRDFTALNALPGIGRSTAGAILAQAFDQPFPILDGNVKRVLARFHGIRGEITSAAVQADLWHLSAHHLPKRRIADYTQAIMDLGATLCTRRQPGCAACPLRRHCAAAQNGLTTSIPARKKARSLPIRNTVMLLVRDSGGLLLLQRRPATGVWAQMWSLPEARDSAHARRLFRHGRPRQIESRKLAPFRHTFSHYHLDVTPLAIDVCATTRVADNADHRWLPLDEAVALCIPAPVRKLILSLAEES